jgi:hypothetical protein
VDRTTSGTRRLRGLHSRRPEAFGIEENRRLSLVCGQDDAAALAEADAGRARLLAKCLDDHLVAVGEELALRAVGKLQGVLFQNSIEASRRFSMVMVEESAESLTTNDPTQRLFWHSFNQPIAEPVMAALEVIVLHELIIRLRHSDLIESTNRSAKAFRFGLRGGSRTEVTPALWSTSRKPRVNRESLSWMRNRLPRGKPLKSSIARRCGAALPVGRDSLP